LKKGGPRFNIGKVRALAAILLAPLFALGVASVAVGIVGGVVREPARPTSVVWSQRVFTSEKDLSGWLESRGGSYETWAKRHPSLASVFETRTPAASPTGPAVATQSETHRRSMVVAPVVAGIALLVLLALQLPRLRYRGRRRGATRRRGREARTPRQFRVRETATPAFAAARSSAGFVAQVGRASSPHLRSLVRAGRESITDVHYALSSPHGRRIVRSIILYTAYVIFAIALGASVAIYYR
jgi:hypothetical protein